MKRILITGNSHVGALKEAAAISDAARHMDFFGCPGTTFDAIQKLSMTEIGLPESHGLSDNEARVIEKVNARTRVRIDPETIIVVVGETHSNSELAFLIADRAFDGVRDVPAKQRLSDSATSVFLNDIAETALSQLLSGPLGAEMDAVIMAPRPAEDCTGVSAIGKRIKAWQRIAEQPDGAAAVLGRYYDIYADKLAANGIRLIPQPPATLAASGLTKSEFTRDSKRLDTRAHEGADKIHMNANYGVHLLERIVAEMLPQADSNPPRHHINSMNTKQETA